MSAPTPVAPVAPNTPANLQSDVFNFVMVRPPQQTNDVTANTLFMYDPRPAGQSGLVNAISKVTGASAVEVNAGKARKVEDLNARTLKAVTAYIASKQLEPDFTDPTEPYQTLSSLFTLFKKANAIKDITTLGAGVASALGLAKSADNAALQRNAAGWFSDKKRTTVVKTIRTTLWESLYSHFILNRFIPVKFEGVIDALRAIHIAEYLSLNGLPPDTKTLNQLVTAVPIMPTAVPQALDADVDLTPINSLQNNFTYIGIGDLLVVKQTLQKYLATEIADIENVLLGESKTRNHRTLDRTEETDTDDTTTTTLEEKDNQTSQRFELKSESDQTIKNDMAVQAGVTVSGKFGPVQVSSNASFSLNNSQDESTKNSSDFAKDVVDRSVSSIQTTVQQIRSRTTLSEVEEINIHSFDNPAVPGNTNISGIYLWVDKLYEAQVYNYGQRPMFQFIIPEPAAFYVYAQENQPAPVLSLDPPPNFTANGQPVDLTLLPMTNAQKNPMLTANQIYPDDSEDNMPANYLELASRFMATGITPCPPLYTEVKYAAGDLVGQGQTTIQKADNQAITIPNGYEAISYHTMLQVNPEDQTWWGIVYVGDYYSFKSAPAGVDSYAIDSDDVGTPNATTTNNVKYQDGVMENETGIIPVSVLAGKIETAVLMITVICQRSKETVQQWKLQTFATISTAYRDWQQNYETKKNEAASDSDDSTTVQGREESVNRVTEKTELKRACINILFYQAYGQYNDILAPSPPASQYPSVNLATQGNDGQFIQFFEQAFDWDQITYLYYPYFWSAQGDSTDPKWIKKLNYDDPDPLFSQFLSAGAARVIVPAANNAFGAAILYYLQNINLPGTQALWNGETVPTIDSDLYKSIIAELHSQQDPFWDAIPTGEAWPVTIPTSLVYLQQGFDLPDFTNPQP